MKEDKNCKNKFETMGAINIQYSALVNHAKSKRHQQLAWALHCGKKAFEEGVLKYFETVEDSMKNLFCVAYYVAKNDLAFTKYVPTLELLRECNTPNILKSIYNNDKACASFVMYIGKELDANYMAHVRQSPCFGIMKDESIEIAIEEHLIVYVSYIVDYEPKVSFLDLLEVGDHTSSSLFASLKNLLLDHGLEAR